MNRIEYQFIELRRFVKKKTPFEKGSPNPIQSYKTK
jgi:hypothetical protein